MRSDDQNHVASVAGIKIPDPIVSVGFDTEPTEINFSFFFLNLNIQAHIALFHSMCNPRCRQIRYDTPFASRLKREVYNVPIGLNF